MTPTRLVTAISLVVLTVSGCGDDFDGPDDHQLSQTTQLVQYDSCGDLERDLKSVLVHEAWAYIEQYDAQRYGGVENDTGAPTSSEGDSKDGGRTEGEDYSGTNNQEAGVDEADIVKTDGYHIYNINGNRLHIFGVPQFGKLVPESVTELEGMPQEMLVDRDAGRAAVFSYISPYSLPKGHPLRALTGVGNDDAGYYWRAPTLTKITVLDISDRTKPSLIREVYYEGWYQTARKVGTSVRVSTFANIGHGWAYDWWDVLNDVGYNKAAAKREVARRVSDLKLTDLVPQMFVRTPDGAIVKDPLTQSECNSFYRPTDSHAHGLASIISFDLLGEGFGWDADHVVSNWATFYASTDTLVLAEQAHDWWWYWWFPTDVDQLNVHTFDISQPGKTSYTGSGRVDGWLVDQFSISEHEGAIRLATTTGRFRWWFRGDDEPEPITNHVWVLENHGGVVESVGHLGGIGTGESIVSARFLGDKGYLVTYLRIDPLWTIDLSNRTEPKLIGELEVPGFSTYLHPLGDTGLLSIGVGGDQNGANWRTTISMFDVSDFAHPTLTSSVPIDADAGWGWSEALWEHKAFQYFAPKKLLGVPQSNYAYTDNGGYRYLSRLELIHVEPGVGLSRYGAIDHSAYYDTNRMWNFVDIRRSIFMGDYVYAISDKAISVHRTSDLGKVTDALLPGYTPEDWYWWW